MKNYKQKSECLLAWLSERKVKKPKKAATEITAKVQQNFKIRK